MADALNPEGGQLPNHPIFLPNGLDGRAMETRNDPLYCSLCDGPVGHDCRLCRVVINSTHFCIRFVW